MAEYSHVNKELQNKESQNKKKPRFFTTKSILYGTFALFFGIIVGVGLGATYKIGIINRSTVSETSLPSRVLDRNGALITTFFSQENRKIVHFQEIPKILMQALITREDQTFFQHSGFSVRGTIRAAYNILLDNFVSGGSTLSQQVAGVKYADRREFSIKRKLKELWWSFQLELSWSKQEIIEEYLNKMYFGHGNYGVETASQFFFDHDAKSINAAEAVMLMIQLANPAYYSPFKNPNIARERQHTILQQMVDLRFISDDTMQKEIQLYWDNFDYTREGYSSAFLERDDKAPYFSEHIRKILKEDLGFSDNDINFGGLTIYTTLDLSFQRKARKYFDEGLKKANAMYKKNKTSSSSKQENILPTIALSSLLFDGSGDFFHRSSLLEQRVMNYFSHSLQPTLSMLHGMFEPSPNSLLANVIKKGKEHVQQKFSEETVEGAMVTIDNNTGHILAMIGGSNFETSNQFNRATSAFVQPGSSFKPLYYVAGIEHKIISPSSIIWDSPVVFFYDETETYTPRNYKGEWKGAVSVRSALSQSMNVPSLKVLQKVGFEKVLDITGRLLNIPVEEREAYGLVEKYPVGLGIVSVAPIAMANAYVTLANGGSSLPPIAIQYIKNKDGKTIINVEQKIKTDAATKSKRIISPQSAYIITSILESTVNEGTLRYAKYQAKGFTQPTAGKTGTTQNWSDAWTLGFTPYFTTAIWFGFDRGGQSLGTNQTGAITTGPVWGKYMEDINKDLPKKDFTKPGNIITVNINPDNNTIATSQSNKVRQEVFIVGTEPKEKDDTLYKTLQFDESTAKLQHSMWHIHIPYATKGRFESTIQKLTQDTLLFSEAYQQQNPYGNLSTNTRNTRSLNLRLKVPSIRRLKDTNTILPTNSNSNNTATIDPSDEDISSQSNPFL